MKGGWNEVSDIFVFDNIDKAIDEKGEKLYTGDRLKVSGDILTYAEPFFQESLVYDLKAVEKCLKPPGTLDLLKCVTNCLATIEPFEPQSIEYSLGKLAQIKGIKLAEIVHPLRVAITGRTVGIGLWDSLAILGKETSLIRLNEIKTKI